MAIIYHGTPLTPRAALNAIAPGRAMCVSFYTPQDVEAVEAVSPAIMFRQRGLFVLAGRAPGGAGMGSGSGLVGLFCMAGAAPVPPRTLGSHPRRAGSAKPAQRRAADGLAVRPEGSAPLAHGRADRSAVEAVRAIRPGLPRLGGGVRPDARRDQAGAARRGLRSMVSPYGRGGGGARQSLACSAHDARGSGRAGISLCERGRDERRAERVAL